MRTLGQMQIGIDYHYCVPFGWLAWIESVFVCFVWAGELGVCVFAGDASRRIDGLYFGLYFALQMCCIIMA